MESQPRNKLPDHAVQAIAVEMWERRVVERLLLLAERRRFPNDEELPPEAVLWGRLGRVLMVYDEDYPGPSATIKAMKHLGEEDLPAELRRRVIQFARGLLE